MVGWQMFVDFMLTLGCDFPVPFPAAFADSVGDIVDLRTGRTMTQVDDMVVDLVNHAAQGSSGFRWRYDATGNILWVHLATAMTWWFRHRRMAGLPTLGTAAIKRQLRERDSREHAGTGQYVQDIKPVRVGDTTMHAYGISLDAMNMAGMDVPDKLSVHQVVMNIGGDK